ncbi:MAG: phosphopantetheine-binding protein [Burkholderia sp.]
MVPAETIALDALPLNANGKLDRAALRARLSDHLAQAANGPAQAEAGAGEAADAAPGSDDAPRGETEQAIATIWAEVIEIDRARIGRSRNFFEVGGDSLLGLKVVARARKLGITITPKQLFQRLTLAELAEKSAAASKPASASASAQPAISPIPAAVAAQESAAELSAIPRRPRSRSSASGSSGNWRPRAVRITSRAACG